MNQYIEPSDKKQENMTTKEFVYTEISTIEEEYLDDLYDVIKRFTHLKHRPKKSGLLARLQQIQIDAPKDFAMNLDLYISGDKHVESNLS